MSDFITPAYDATISGLINLCEIEWGKPEENRKNLLPFGIRPIDKALYGMDTTHGELIVVQGPEKQRKTTKVINVVANFMTSEKPEVKPLTVIDALESGMDPRRYRDQIIANVATRYLLAKGHKHREHCPVCNSSMCKELTLSPEFLRFNRRSDAQLEAITYAMDTIKSWPLRIYGANPKEGNTRDLSSVNGNNEARWTQLIDTYGAKVFVVDHVQQYSFRDEPTDYEKQLRAVSALSDAVAKYGVIVIMLSQVSLTSQRDAAAGVGKYYAAGGRKAAAEATSIFSVNYESGSGKMCITLEDSRKSASFSVWQTLEDTSGAFYGEATQGPKAGYRPGMDEGVKHGRPGAR